MSSASPARSRAEGDGIEPATEVDMIDATVTKPTLPVFGTLVATLRVFARAPLLFIALSILSSWSHLARLIVVGAPRPSEWSLLLATVGLDLLVGIYTATCMTFAAERLHAGARPVIGTMLALGARRYLPVAVMSIIVILGFYLGLALLVAPGLFLLALWSVATPACALERLGPLASLRRSATLTRGVRWRILGIHALLLVPQITFDIVLNHLAMRVGHELAGAWITAVVAIGILPLLTITSTLIYCACKARSEGAGVALVFD